MISTAAIVESLLYDAGEEYIVKAYRIPSPAMMPSLIVGDHVYVDEVIYWLGSSLRKGEVVVFKFPEEETKDFVKRVVALPGDTVEIGNNSSSSTATALTISGIHNGWMAT